MARINPSFQNLKEDYIFPIIEKRLERLSQECDLINLGIGDISLPLAPSIAKAIIEATKEMTTENGKKGYGPFEGYCFLRKILAENEYRSFGIEEEEIFISDGATFSLTAILELFDHHSTVGITDPTYPLYRDAAIFSEKKLHTILTNEENGFTPKPPKERVDLMYLCTPNNPTGIALREKELQTWIDWARENESILIIDKVYCAFIQSSDSPKSLYALEGAKEVVIEIGSFSKFAGFTGLRCGHMVLPKKIQAEGHFLHPLWTRRCASLLNGFPYPIQKGAEACYTPQAKKEISTQVTNCHEVGQILRKGLKNLGETFYGGVDSPYIFWKAPRHLTSWEFFEILLEKSHILAIPGSGFGTCGENYVRLSCFTTKEEAKKAVDRLSTLAIRN